LRRKNTACQAGAIKAAPVPSKKVKNNNSSAITSSIQTSTAIENIGQRVGGQRKQKYRQRGYRLHKRHD